MNEPDTRRARRAELRQRLPALVRALQEPGITPLQMAELSADFLAVHGAVMALGDELDSGSD